MGKLTHNTALATAPVTILPKRRSRAASSAAGRMQLLPQRLNAALAAAFSNAVATVTVSLAGMAIAPMAHAQNLPQGGQVVQGGATFQYNGQTLNVNTTNGAGNRSAINWQSFNIGAGNTTNINQPNAQSTSLNRVVAANPSAIFGTLNSNGQVVLVNQNGIAVGRGGVVDTAGFTASTLNISDADYAAGKLRFTGNGLSGGVQVDGTIRSANGDITLLAPHIATGADALVKASNGNVVLGAGQEVEITGRGLEGVKFIVQSPGDTATNLGNLQGNAVGIFAGTLKHSGAITAQTATLQGGKVVLKALGVTVVSGSIDATGVEGANTQGGTVQILGGNLVDLQAGAVVDVSGDTRGGSILVGGGYQGKDLTVVNAQTTQVAQGVALQANARTKGDGGQVVVWADDTTRFKGSVSAKGGSQSGNGGNVETSGKKQLFLGGTVDTSAAKGKFGSWLLDPADLAIKGGARGSDPGTANTIYETDIESAQSNIMLQADNSITTTGGFGGAGIDLKSPGQSISLNVTASNGGSPAIAMNGVAINTNKGAVTVSVNGSNPGSINMGNISTNSGAIDITSKSNVDGSPSGQVNFGGIVNTNGGAISVNAGGINVAGGKAVAYLDAAAGNINLQATSAAGINITSPGNTVSVGGKNITLITDALTINGATDIGSATGTAQTERVTVKPFSANNISLGGFTVPGVLGLSQATLDRIKVNASSGVLQIGDAGTFSGTVFIANPIRFNQSTVSLLTDPIGSISQAAAIDASTSYLRLEAGTVTLRDAGNKMAGYAGQTTRGRGGDFDVTTSNQNLLLNTIDGATGITSTGAVNLTSAFNGSLGVDATLNLNGDINSRGNVTITGFNRIQLLKATTLIDTNTNTNNAGNSGNIDLGAATIFSSGLNQGLVLDTSSTNGAGGSISMGSVAKSDGEYLNGIVLNSQGTSNGQINLTAGDITVGGGGVTLSGNVALSAASSITTGGGNVVISGSVDGPQKFFIAAGAGDVTIFAPIGSTSAVAELKVGGKNITVDSIDAVDATASGKVISLNATGNLTVRSGASIKASTAASASKPTLALAPASPDTPAGITLTAGGTLTVGGNAVQADGNILLSGKDVAINSLFVDSRKGNIDITSENTLVIAGGANAVAVNGTNGVTLAGQTIELLGGSGTGGATSVSSAAGSITVNAAGNFVIRGGFGDNAYAQLLAAGPVTVTAGKVNINGGSGRGAYAKLDQTNAGTVLNINASAVNLQGGDGSGSYAAIVSNGDIVLTPSSSMSLVQGAGLDADATVLSYAGNVTLPTVCNGCVRLTANPLGNNQTDSGVLGIPPPRTVTPPVVTTPPVATTISVVQTQDILNNLINPIQTTFGAGQDAIVIEGAICR